MSKFLLLPLKSASYLHCIPSPSPTLTTLTYQSPSLLLKKKCYFLWTQDNSNFFRFPREGYFRVIGSRLYFLRAAIGCKYGEFAVKTEIAKFLILSQRKPLRETFSKITIKLFPKNFLFRENRKKVKCCWMPEPPLRNRRKLYHFKGTREEKRFIFSLSSPPPPLLLTRPISFCPFWSFS